MVSSATCLIGKGYKFNKDISDEKGKILYAKGEKIAVDQARFLMNLENRPFDENELHESGGLKGGIYPPRLPLRC